MNRRDAIRKSALVGGATLFGSSLITILQSCQSEPRIDWQPEFLSVDQARLISSLVDAVLPKTDTPGGLDVKVDIFMDRVFANLYDEAAQQGVVKEMGAFEEKCQKQFGKSFADLDDKQRISFLQAEEAASPKYNPGVWGTRVGEQKPVGFLRSMKSLMLWGYFTSKEIGKDVLSYDPIPTEYKGCIPLSDVGRVWSL